MGKAALVFAFGTVLYLSYAQLSSQDTHNEVSGVKVEFQENTLASEIARSAYAMAERRARAVDGSADSVVAVLNGFTGKTTGDYQGGTYEYSARKRSNTLVTISAKGFFGGESHEITRSMRVDYIPDTDWNYGCNAAEANFVEITGFGMGDAYTLLNDGKAIMLQDTSTIKYIKAQVGGRVDRINAASFITIKMTMAGP